MTECETCGDVAPDPVAGETRALCRECELTEDVAYWQRRCDALTRRIEALERVVSVVRQVCEEQPLGRLVDRAALSALDAIDTEESDG